MRQTALSQAAPREAHRIVVLGGGVGGLTATRELERLCRGHRDRELVLVSVGEPTQVPPLAAAQGPPEWR